MRIPKYRAYLKNITGLNKHHFETHGRMFDVISIDFENETVAVRTPSLLDFHFSYVELMRETGFKDKKKRKVFEGDVLKFNGYCRLTKEKFSVLYEIYWDTEENGWEKRPLDGRFRYDDWEDFEVVGNIYEKDKP